MILTEPHFHVAYYVHDLPAFVASTVDGYEALEYFLPLCRLFYGDQSMHMLMEKAVDIVETRGLESLFAMTASEDEHDLALFNCKEECVNSPSFN